MAGKTDFSTYNVKVVRDAKTFLSAEILAENVEVLNRYYNKVNQKNHFFANTLSLFRPKNLS